MGEAMEKFAIETSMVKVFGSDTSHYVIDEGLQIYGGYGFLEEYPMPSAYRDDRINQIWEGTNEINRQIISGFMMKKALMEEIPIREAINEIETYMSNGEIKVENDLLAEECHSIETAKRFALYLFNEALCKYGQDLKHEQQITEIIADIFTDIYSAEGIVVRSQKIMDSDSPDSSVIDIAKVYTAEMVNRIMSLTHIVIAAIYTNNPSSLVNQKIIEFENRMRLKTNVIGLKRKVAQNVFESNGYPY